MPESDDFTLDVPTSPLRPSQADVDYLLAVQRDQLTRTDRLIAWNKTLQGEALEAAEALSDAQQEAWSNGFVAGVEESERWRRLVEYAITGLVVATDMTDVSDVRRFLEASVKVTGSAAEPSGDDDATREREASAAPPSLEGEG